MTRLIMVAALVAALGLPAVMSAQPASAAGTSLGSVTLKQRVMADGKPLAAGTYQLRLTSDAPKPGPGQNPDAERYVEFVRGGKVVGRELASVIPASEMDALAESRKPAPNSVKVEKLKGDDYIRVWINRGGNNYIINMPPA